MFTFSSLLFLLLPLEPGAQFWSHRTSSSLGQWEIKAGNMFPLNVAKGSFVGEVNLAEQQVGNQTLGCASY